MSYKWKLSKQYLIIRSIYTTEIEDQETVLLLFNQFNDSTRTGIRIEQGLCYPIDEELPVVIQCGETKKQFTFSEMKGLINQQIIF